jgi:hypothetical protein
MVFDYVVHHHLLSGLYAETKGLWRAPEDVRFPVYLAATAIAAIALTAAFALYVSPKSVAVGVKLGALLGIGFGAVDALIDYAFMPIPIGLAAGWYLSTVIGVAAAGAILGKLIRDG